MMADHVAKCQKGGTDVSTAMPRKRALRQWWRARAQGLVEYALILALLVIVCIVIVSYLGSIVFNNMYSTIASSMPDP